MEDIKHAISSERNKTMEKADKNILIKNINNTTYMYKIWIREKNEFDDSWHPESLPKGLRFMCWSQSGQ